MKKLILFLLFISLPLAFSSCKDETTPTKEEVVLESITCVDKENNDIEKITYVIHQSEYIYKDVIVYAKYSDGSKGDVTAFASFSNIDLYTLGEKEVTVSYKGLSDKFVVIVTAVDVERIELDTTKTKVIYKLNELLNTEELKVYEVLSNGYIGEITEYKCTITDENNKVYAKFTKTGTFQVEVNYKNKYAFYNVYVYDESFNYSLDININELELENNAYKYKEDDIIYSNDSFSFIPYGDLYLNTVDENNKEIYTEFLGFKYYYHLKLDSNSQIIFNTKKSFKMILLIDGINASDITITNSNGEVVDYYKEEIGFDSVLHLSNVSGSYTISSSGTINIKAVLLKIEETKEIKRIEIDSTNVQINFEPNEKFNCENIKVYAYYNETEKEEIDINECEVLLSKGDSLLTGFTGNGVYVVTVNYTDNNDNIYSDSYEILVKSDETEYTHLELDISNVQTEFSKDDVFNYAGLIVYGVNATGKTELILKSCKITLYYYDGFNKFAVNEFSPSPGTYFVEIKYQNRTNDLNISYDITYDLGYFEYYTNITPTVNISEDGIVSVSIINVLTSVSVIKFSIYCDGKLLTNLNLFDSSISNLNQDKTYVLKGYYIGMLNQDEYIVYLEDTEIKFN